MYHWYGLMKSWGDVSPSGSQGDIVASPAGPEKRGRRPLTAKEKWRMFWVGSVESMPLLVGAFAVTRVKSVLLVMGVGLLAALLTCLLAWLFRNAVPKPPVEAQETE